MQMMSEVEAVEVLRGYLEEYLRSQGAKFNHSKMFECISPDHKDSDPSCGIVPASEGKVFHCFGCGISGNIFSAAFFLEGLPREGPMFWKRTLPELAKRYDIQYEEREVSEEEREVQAKLAAYGDAASVIARNKDELAGMLEYRGWKPETGRLLGLGAIKSVDEYLASMERLGWSQPFLKKIGLVDNGHPPFIFNDHSLIFPIKNFHGAVVAFGARNMTWQSDADGHRYYNSSNSDIYEKHTLVYNLDLAKRRTGPLIIVEGYADVAGVLDKNPTARVVATCGTNLYMEQIAAIKKAGIVSIELAFDGDKAGEAGTSRAIEELSQIPEGMMVKVVRIPDAEDPDSCSDVFMSLKRSSAFEWKLIQTQSSTTKSPEEIAQEVIPSILTVSDRIERHAMVKELASVTGLPAGTILEEISRREDVQGRIRREREDAIKTNMLDALKKGKDVSEVIGRATLMLSSINEEFGSSSAFSEDTYASDVRKMMGAMETGEDRKARLHLTGLPKTYKWLDGFPSTGVMILVGGIPHCGKTSWLRFLSWNLARTNEKVTVIYHNVDEPLRRMVPSLAAIQSKTAMSQVAHFGNQPKDVQAAILDGYRVVESMAKEGRYIALDARAGTSLDSIERIVTSYQDKYPDRRVVYVFDNFHKLTDFSTSDRYTKFTACSKQAQALCLKYDFPLIMTVELKKIDTRSGPRRGPGASEPRPEDMKETGSLYYDADIVWLIHNDLHVNPGTNHFWTKVDGKDLYGGHYAYHMKHPVLDVAWHKNRETGMQGKIHFKYDPLRNWFQEVDVIPHHEEEEKEKANRPPAVPLESTSSTLFGAL